jgi:hypothetical protein
MMHEEVFLFDVDNTCSTTIVCKRIFTCISASSTALQHAIGTGRFSNSCGTNWATLIRALPAGQSDQQRRPAESAVSPNTAAPPLGRAAQRNGPLALRRKVVAHSVAGAAGRGIALRPVLWPSVETLA